MKTLLLFPPQWSPLSPHSALTLLAGNLRANGIETDIKDVNIEFYKHILTPEYLGRAIAQAYTQEANILEELNKDFSASKSVDDYTQDFQINANKYLKIKQVKDTESSKIKKTLELLPYAMRVLNHQEEFYSLSLFTKAIVLIDQALKYITLPYFPAELSLHDYKNQAFKFTFEDIKKHSLNRAFNIYYTYYDTIIPPIAEKNYDLIGISISSYSQFIGGLTLANLLKTQTNSHICLGGNYISRITDTLLKYPEFFELYAHSAIFEEGEKPLLELAKAIEQNKPLSNVPNLIFLNESNNTVMTEKAPPIKLNDAPTPDLNGYNFKDYFMPEIVMPIHASRGCYWKNCTFCDHDYGQTYNVKSVDKLITELKELKEKFNISYFEFIDEAISPGYLKKMSEKIIEEDLNINWYCNARLESGLTEDILKLARKAGLRMILWGYESGSKKIMELINKGVDIEKRLDILKAANNADIWNFAYIFFGFPSEKEEDAMETVNTICENTDIIHAYGKSLFSLGKHALMKLNPEKFGITKFSTDIEPFSSNCSYEMTDMLNKEELENINQLFIQRAMKNYTSKAWMYITYRETLFLYICKYGADAVKKMECPF